MLWVQSVTSLAALTIRFCFNSFSDSNLLIYLRNAVLSTFNSFISTASSIQLRGRSGRQGDPGSSRFFLSLEDNIFRIFGGDRIQVISSFRILVLVNQDMVVQL